MKIGKDKFNMKGLEELERILKTQGATVKVGILGDSGSREGDGGSDQEEDDDAIDNAGIGLIHEFGTENIPERSWLRMPLIEKFESKLDDAGAFNKKTIEKVIREKSSVTMFKKIGIIAEECIQEAFDTGGFGKWKPSNFSLKKNEQTLVETQQLRDSVTSEVVS